MSGKGPSSQLVRVRWYGDHCTAVAIEPPGPTVIGNTIQEGLDRMAAELRRTLSGDGCIVMVGSFGAVREDAPGAGEAEAEEPQNPHLSMLSRDGGHTGQLKVPGSGYHRRISVEGTVDAAVEEALATLHRDGIPGAVLTVEAVVTVRAHLTAVS